MNKRLERGLRILILLQSGTQYDAMKLAREMKVTRRTIFRDIAMLKELGLTIDFDVDQSTYCVQVQDSAGGGGNRRLDTEELGQALQHSLAGEDPETASSAMVIRQLALNLASASRQLSDIDPYSARDNAPFGHQELSHQSNVVGSAPHIGSRVQTHRFAKRSDLICFLIEAIDSQRDLTVWNRAEEKELCVVASEIRYAANTWTLVAITKVGVVLTLPICRLDFVCKIELAEISDGRSE